VNSTVSVGLKGRNGPPFTKTSFAETSPPEQIALNAASSTRPDARLRDARDS